MEQTFHISSETEFVTLILSTLKQILSAFTCMLCAPHNEGEDDQVLGLWKFKVSGHTVIIITCIKLVIELLWQSWPQYMSVPNKMIY